MPWNGCWNIDVSRSRSELVPATDYLTAINIGFLGLYSCIALNTIIPAIVIHYRKRENPVLATRINRLGIIISPITVILVGLLCAVVASRTVRDKLFDTPPQVVVRF